MPKNVIVLGVPRSGTSMLAGIFARAGYFVAEEPSDELRPGDAHNPGGYWEAEALVDRNVEVLNAVGFQHHNTWLFEPISSESVGRIGDLTPPPAHAEFVAGYERQAPWLWKDPRLCYTLGYWWQLMDPRSVAVVLTTRNPASIYRSFVRLKWCEKSSAGRARVRALINDHLAAARRSLGELEIPHVVASYEGLRSEPEVMARALSRHCDIDIKASDLRFDKRYDHSTLRGAVSITLERWADGMSPKIRRNLKRMVPTVVRAAMFPERRED